MSTEPRCPEDSGHIHEERFMPGVPGVIPAPPPPPDDGAAPGKPAAKKSKSSGGADEAPSVVKETV